MTRSDGTSGTSPPTGAYASERPPERFTDSGFGLVPWTEDLALRLARVSRSSPRPSQLAQLHAAVDHDVLPPDAVDALVAAGWDELLPGPVERDGV